MRKHKNSRLPRSAKVMLHVLEILLLGSLLYILGGCPAFSAQQQFRREERANLTGPARILDTVSLQEYTYLYPCDSLLLAESDEGITLFSYKSGELERNDFTYRKKTGDITVLPVPVPGYYNFETKDSAAVPILVFDSVPDAARAELKLTLSAQRADTAFQKDYALKAERNAQGYFLFTLSVSSSGQLGGEGEALTLLTQISDDDPFSPNAEVSFPATVLLYNKEDDLICKRTVQLRSPSGLAHNE